jgi:hypothetical protein
MAPSRDPNADRDAELKRLEALRASKVLYRWDDEVQITSVLAASGAAIDGVLVSTLLKSHQLSDIFWIAESPSKELGPAWRRNGAPTTLLTVVEMVSYEAIPWVVHFTRGVARESRGLRYSLLDEDLRASTMPLRRCSPTNSRLRSSPAHRGRLQSGP